MDVLVSSIQQKQENARQNANRAMSLLRDKSYEVAQKLESVIEKYVPEGGRKPYLISGPTALKRIIESDANHAVGSSQILTRLKKVNTDIKGWATKYIKLIVEESNVTFKKELLFSLIGLHEIINEDIFKALNNTILQHESEEKAAAILNSMKTKVEAQEYEASKILANITSKETSNANIAAATDGLLTLGILHEGDSVLILNDAIGDSLVQSGTVIGFFDGSTVFVMLDSPETDLFVKVQRSTIISHVPIHSHE